MKDLWFVVVRSVSSVMFVRFVFHSSTYAHTLLPWLEPCCCGLYNWPYSPWKKMAWDDKQPNEQKRNWPELEEIFGVRQDIQAPLNLIMLCLCHVLCIPVCDMEIHSCDQCIHVSLILCVQCTVNIWSPLSDTQLKKPMSKPLILEKQFYMQLNSTNQTQYKYNSSDVAGLFVWWIRLL